MKVPTVPPVSARASAESSPSQPRNIPAAGSFRELMGTTAIELQRGVEALDRWSIRAAHGAVFSTSELLRVQMQVNAVHVRCEMVARAVDGVGAVIRKLQGG